MFKTETHAHVKESSKCGKIFADDMSRAYKDAGYKTVIIADHFQQRAFPDFYEISWEEKVDRFYKGYESAKIAGEKYNVNVIFSCEVRFNESSNHYLLLGIDKDFLLKRSDLFDMGIKEFYPYAKEHGVTVVQAHPYRDGKNFPTTDYVDAIEIINSNPRHENYTDKTIKLAEETHLPTTAGSDAHREEDIALSGVISKTEIKTADDYVKLLLTKELELIK